MAQHDQLVELQRQLEESQRKHEESQRQIEESQRKHEESQRKIEESQRKHEESQRKHEEDLAKAQLEASVANERAEVSAKALAESERRLAGRTSVQDVLFVDAETADSMMLLPGKTGPQSAHVQLAFCAPYVDSAGVRSRLFEQFNLAARSDSHNYLAVVQGSGWGKTRGVVETCGEFMIPSVYICLRESGSSGYPRRGEYVTAILDVLKNGKPDVFYGAMARVVEMRLLQYQAGGGSLSGSSNGALSWPFGLTDTNAIDDQGFWKHVFAVYKKDAGSESPIDLQPDGLAALDNAACAIRTLTGKSFTASNIRLLIIWDESRSLVKERTEHGHEKYQLTLFRELRRVLWSPKFFSGCVSVFLDTSSRVSHFLPQIADDASSRELRLKLQPPIIHFVQPPDSWPVVSQHASASAAASVVVADGIDPDQRRLRLFFRGRPLWSHLCKGGSSVDDVVALARSKFGQCSDNPFHNTSRAVAIVSAVAQMDIQPMSQLAPRLVSSNLGTLLAVNQQRSGLVVAYPSEPVVAKAALRLLQEGTLSIVQLVTRSLQQGLLSTTAGASGELVARLVLLLHRDVKFEGYNTEECLQAYLEALVGMLALRVCDLLTVLVL